MIGKSKIISGFARLATGVAGSVFSIQEELKAHLQSRREETINKMGFVTNDDVESIRKQAEEVGAENKVLKERLDTLESSLKTQQDFPSPTESPRK